MLSSSNRFLKRFFAVVLLIFCWLRLFADSPNAEAFPRTTSKKGLQIQMIDDAIALGVKHAALNVDLASLIDPNDSANSLTLSIEGTAFRFRRPAVESLDRQCKALTDAGAVVTFILLNYKNSNERISKIMLHPRYDPACPNHLSAFNTVTAEGSNYFRATMEFLARRYSGADRAHGRAWNYIIGNEVNSHWFWCNMGRVPMREFADDYLRAVRMAHDAIKKYSLNARVYVSLEHHWNMRYAGGDDQKTFAARPFLEYVAQRSRQEGDFDWNIAFHPYPENLFNPRTWLDKTATTNDDTSRITFKNLEMLPRFLRQPPLQFHGEQRRVILSEQGFHTPDAPDGEDVQAAAFCYAYYKSAHIDGIDAFILHRHVDHRMEGGLKLGLWTRNEKSPSPSEPLQRKRIYEVFRAADTEEWENAFRFALPIIGIHDWNEILPAR